MSETKQRSRIIDNYHKITREITEVILGRKSMVLRFHFCHNEDDGHP